MLTENKSPPFFLRMAGIHKTSIQNFLSNYLSNFFFSFETSISCGREVNCILYFVPMYIPVAVNRPKMIVAIPTISKISIVLTSVLLLFNVLPDVWFGCLYRLFIDFECKVSAINGHWQTVDLKFSSLLLICCRRSSCLI